MRRALTALVRKELRQTVRDARMMVLLIVVPTIQIIVFGFAIDLEVDQVPTVVVDHDRTVESRRHLRRLFADGTLRRAHETADDHVAERHLVDGRANVALIFPSGFQRDLLRGRPTQVQALVDGSDPNRGRSAATAVSGYFARVAPPGAAPGVRPPVRVEPRLLFNPGLDTPKFMLPGITAILLLMVTSIVAAMGLARERQTGTLEQLMVTPMRPSTVILGKMLPFAGFGFLDLTLALTASVVLFEVPTRGSLIALYATGAVYLLATLSTGLFIATVSRTQQQAFLGGFLFLLPSVLLSGMLTPIRAMPGWLELATWLNPVRHFVELIRANLLGGAGFLERWPNLLALAIYGVLMTALSISLYRKTLE